MSDDLRFDRLLQEEAAVLPPAAAEVNPWRESMGLVLWGIGLTTITLNFLLLDTILPALGAILMALGFRTLRRENRALGGCYGLSIALAAARSAVAVLAALPVETGNASGYGIMVLTLALYICLWRGMVGVSRAAGAEKPAARAAGALVIFYVVLFLLAHVGLEGWLAVLPLLIVYIVILRNLVKLARSLSDTGYAIHAAPVRLSSAAVLWGYLGLTLAAVLLAMFLGQRLPMDWQVRDDAPQDATIRAQLLDLGFPEKVLDDLTAEEVARLSGAERIRVEESPLYQNRSRTVTVETKVDEETHPRWFLDSAQLQPDGSYLYTYQVYDFYEDVMTHILVYFPEEDGVQRCVMLHYLSSFVQPKHRYTEAIQIRQDARSGTDFQQGEWCSGRVLYTQQGQERVMAYVSLTRQVENGESFMSAWDYRYNTINALWSTPNGGENLRAYVMHEVMWTLYPEELDRETWVNSWVEYLRQTQPTYPFRDPITLRSSVTTSSLEVYASRVSDVVSPGNTE